MSDARLSQYGGSMIRTDDRPTVEMINPNDNASKRFQYRPPKRRATSDTFLREENTMKRTTTIIVCLLLAGSATAGELQVQSMMTSRAEDCSTAVGVEVRYLHPVRGPVYGEVLAGEYHSMGDTCTGYPEEDGCRSRYVGAGVGVERALPWGLTGRVDVTVTYLSLDCDQAYHLDDTWVIGFGGSMVAPINEKVALVASLRYDFDQSVQHFRDDAGDTEMDFDARGFKLGVGLAIRW